MFCAATMETIPRFCLIVSIYSWASPGTPGSARSCRNSAPLALQNVECFLVLCLKRHDEVVRGNFAPPVFVHLAHEDVVQAWWGHTKKTWMQWRNGRDIQGDQTSESPLGTCVQYVYMQSRHINIFNASLTVWAVSCAAHLTFWGELYQQCVTAQRRRQTQSHGLLKIVNQKSEVIII